MSVLQRAPIRVFAPTFCGNPEAAVKNVAERLLDKAHSTRPYAGAIIRSVVQEPQLERLNQLPLDEQRNELASMTFLEAIDEAVIERWPSEDLANTYSPGKLKLRAYCDGNMAGHVDPKIRFMGDKPDIGGLACLFTIDGAVEYKLSALKKYPTNSDDAEFFLREAYRRHGSRGVHRMVAGPGDLVIIPENPPVSHSARELKSPRTTVLYTADYLPPK